VSDWSVLPLMFMREGKTMHCHTEFFDTIRPPYLSFRDYKDGMKNLSHGVTNNFMQPYTEAHMWVT